MKRFGKSHLDIQFRRIVAGKLASAKNEVIIVTGESSAFTNYLDLQLAVREAAMRGVKFRVYSNIFLPDVARKLKKWGGELYTGAERLRDHFMIIDGNEVVVSKAHPASSIGDRHGFITRRGISKYKTIFQGLVRKGRPVRRVKGPDPLETWLANPIRGVWSDSSGVDDSLI